MVVRRRWTLMRERSATTLAGEMGCAGHQCKRRAAKRKDTKKAQQTQREKEKQNDDDTRFLTALDELVHSGESVTARHVRDYCSMNSTKARRNQPPKSRQHHSRIPSDYCGGKWHANRIRNSSEIRIQNRTGTTGTNGKQPGKSRFVR